MSSINEYNTYAPSKKAVDKARADLNKEIRKMNNEVDKEVIKIQQQTVNRQIIRR